MDITLGTACQEACPPSQIVFLPVVEAAFTERFKRSVRFCVRKGFTIEECFGLIWEEVCEEIKLPESQQRHLFDELLNWARLERKA